MSSRWAGAPVRRSRSPRRLAAGYLPGGGAGAGAGAGPGSGFGLAGSDGGVCGGGVGCTGGRHRSVTLATELAERLKGLEGVEVAVEHREL